VAHKDLAVKTGSYTDRDGNTKNRYENIGRLMDGKDGQYLLLKRTFNPAGISVDADRDMIVVSVFEPREQGDKPARQEQPRESSQPPQNGEDPDIPF
jgi:hypothetical protein